MSDSSITLLIYLVRIEIDLKASSLAGIGKSTPDGSTVRLKDVARVEFGAFAYSANTKIAGKPGIGIALFQTAGSNANDILTEAQAVMEKASKDFPKGIEYFNQAIDSDPNYALAYSGLADTYALIAAYTNQPAREVMPKAKEAARHALQRHKR